MAYPSLKHLEKNFTYLACWIVLICFDLEKFEMLFEAMFTYHLSLMYPGYDMDVFFVCFLF